jgi:signal transduction histidine kinase
MHERLESIGGRFDVLSSADGTSVIATIANT